VNPRVSVVIPTYNRRQLLLEAIASVQAQSFADLEILVCDDGSNDGSAEAVRGLAASDARIRLIEAGHSGYPGVVRNRGIAAAQGEWIAFQDSDDLWLRAKLEKQLALLRRAPEAEFVWSYAATLYPDGKTRRMTPFRIRRSGRVFETFLFYSVIATPTVLVKKALLDRAGRFDERMKLTVGEDYELFLRLAAQTPFHFVPEDLVLCRNQPDSISADLLGNLDQVEQVLDSIVRRFQVPQPLAKRALSRIELRRYKQHLLGGYPRAVRLRDLTAALQRDPASKLGHALRAAETLRCASLVKALLQSLPE
jgi:glycosyltransferase involved in cell wall biosynthesis